MPLDLSKLPDALMGVGNILGALGEIESGGRIRNPVLPMIQQRQDALDKEILRRLQQRRLEMDEKRLGMEEEGLRLKKEESGRRLLSDLFQHVLPNIDDEEQANKLFQNLIKSDALKDIVGDEDLSNIRYSKKTKGLAGTREFKREEGVLDPISGQPIEGLYEFEGGKLEGGKWTFSKLKPAKTTADSPFAKVDPSKYTPESIAEFSKTGDHSKLVPREEPVKPKDVGNDREALALERGYSSFAEAPQNVKAEINKEVKRREDERLRLSQMHVNVADANRNFQQESSLRKEFLAQNKTFVDIRDSYARVQAAAKDPSAAGDLALVFSYMKILDPISVVREGEQATAENARGVPEGIRNLYNKVLTGQKLGPNQRKDFVDRAGRLYKAQEEQYKKSVTQYGRIADAAGLNRQNILVDLLSPTPGGGPKILSIEKVP